MLEVLVVKIKKQMAGWKSVLLSNGENLILIKYVLLSMPIHSLSVLSTPKTVLQVVLRLFSEFFWGEANGKAEICGWHGLKLVNQWLWVWVYIT